MKTFKKILKIAVWLAVSLFAVLGAAFGFQFYALSRIPLSQPENARIPVLVYHEIAPASNSKFILPVADFKKQMDLLKEAGATTLTVAQFYEHLKTNTPFPPNSVILTFDDAWLGQYEYALPILKQNGFTGTFYIPVGNVHSQKPVDPYGKIMSWGQVRELDKLGFDIESHTLYHVRLANADPITAFKELLGSRLWLERELKKPVDHISYPHGSYNPLVETLAVAAGYKSGALTTKISSWKVPYFVRIKRKEIKGSMTDEAFKAILANQAAFDHFK